MLTEYVCLRGRSVDVDSGVISALHNESNPYYLEPHCAMRYFPARDVYVDLMVHENWDHLASFNAATGQRLQ